MLDNVAVQQYNDSFLQKIATVEGQAQLSEAGRQYVKTELLEAAFSRAILPQEPITTADCQRNKYDNSLYVIRDIEPSASALGVDNMGEPDGTYVKGERYIIPIVNFVTKRFQITVEDLRAYQYKITKRIEDKSVPILERLEDKFFMRLMGAAAFSSPLAAGNKAKMVGTGGVSPVNLEFQARDFIKIKNTLASGINGSDPKKKEVACLLMTQEIYESAVLLVNAGDDFGKDRVLNGITSDTLFGTKVIRTIKSDLLPNGHIWGFTTPDFLGHNFSLGDPTFEIKSNFGLIEWQTKESIGMGIGNTTSVALLTLAGSSTPGLTGGDLAIAPANDGDITNANVQAVANYYAGLKI